MQVKVCKNCRKLFNYISGPYICSNCSKLLGINTNEINDNIQNDTNIMSATLNPEIKEEEEQYLKVRDYVTKHPHASILVISQDTQVKSTKIFEWVRQDRIAFSDNCKYAWLNCEGCGVKIKSGTLCSKCKRGR